MYSPPMPLCDILKYKHMLNFIVHINVLRFSYSSDNVTNYVASHSQRTYVDTLPGHRYQSPKFGEQFIVS